MSAMRANARFALRLAAALLVAAFLADAGAAAQTVRWESRAALAPWHADLDGMARRRVIRALVVYSRTLYFVDGGRQYGVSYETLRAFEAELNRRLGTRHGAKVEILYLPVRRDELVAALVEGRGDIAVADLAVTPERAQRVDFSVPFATGVHDLVVTGPGSPPIATADDLSGRDVFVRRSSHYYDDLVRLNERLARAGRPPARLRLAPEALEDEDLLEMANAGLVGAIVVDRRLATFWQQVLKDIVLHPGATLGTRGEIAWMFRKGSPGLKAAVDEFARTHGAGTLFGNELKARYLRSTRFVAGALAGPELEKYRRLASIFRTYSDRYDLDHLLMLAQGYRESRLDQSARSAVGAIGVMQVMPATGRAMKVGDISEVEPNVHCGVKYMRTLIDRYFRDAPADRLNRTLFALAAYNAGPARIQRLRRAAAARGLDPDVWFDNVERIVAEKHGAETVAYVSHIYKYYVAYTLVAQDEAERRGAREALTEKLSR
jgi:membrane-bound lytic murein transglycosylase MltF